MSQPHQQPEYNLFSAQQTLIPILRYQIDKKVQQFLINLFYQRMGHCHSTQDKHKNQQQFDSNTTNKKIDQPSSIAKPTTTSSRPSILPQNIIKQVRVEQKPYQEQTKITVVKINQSVSYSRVIKMIPISISKPATINRDSIATAPIKTQQGIQAEFEFVCSKCQRSTMEQEPINYSKSQEASLDNQPQIGNTMNPQQNKLRQTRKRLKISWNSNQPKATSAQPQIQIIDPLDLNRVKQVKSHRQSPRTQSQIYTLHEHSNRIRYRQHILYHPQQHGQYARNPYMLGTLQEAVQNGGKVRKPASSM